ncbi:MAG: hypothetical protein WC284_16280 [Candidimonas sp.]
MRNPHVDDFIKSENHLAEGLIKIKAAEDSIVMACFPIIRHMKRMSFECEESSVDDIDDLLTWISARQPSDPKNGDIFVSGYFFDGEIKFSRIHHHCDGRFDYLIASYEGEPIRSRVHVGRIWRWTDEEWLLCMMKDL